MSDLARTLKSLADPTRLRLLRLLAAEALSVGELTAILGAAQPTVSKQLGALKRAGLLREERNGSFAFYRLDADGAGPLWEAVAAGLAREGDAHGDLARLAEVLRRREERGGARRRVLEPGRSWPAWARALGWLVPPLRVADLGCGDGALTAEIARWASSVVAVDHDRECITVARKRIRKGRLRNVRFRCEAIEQTGLPDACVDVVVLSQALHFFRDPDAPLAQAHRILVPGGRLLLLDLAPHGEAWVQDKLGHVHLGFPETEVAARLRRAGFRAVQTEDMPKGPGQPFRILLVTGVKPPTRRSR